MQLCREPRFAGYLSRCSGPVVLWPHDRLHPWTPVTRPVPPMCPRAHRYSHGLGIPPWSMRIGWDSRALDREPLKVIRFIEH